MKRIQISEPPKETFGRDVDCFEVSDETCAKIKALVKADKPKPYQFQAGDVCTTTVDTLKRIILHQGGLKGFCVNGYWAGSIGQGDFEKAGYKKIGVISDFIK